MKHLQFFGRIEIAEGQTVQGMVCVDADEPELMMLHQAGEGEKAAAILANVADNGRTLDLKPEEFFRTRSAGGLYLPQLTEEERHTIRQYRARLTMTGRMLRGRWTREQVGGSLDFRAPKAKTLGAETCETWAEFKAWATRSRDVDQVVAFRGHGSNKFALKTTFHRMGRTRLERYCSGELLEFKSQAEMVLGTRIDLSNGEDYSMTLALAQHHGLPTPLLDWTSSPYIAAFFAFTDALEAARKRDTHVRVFGLTRNFVARNTPPVVTLPQCVPYVSLLSVPPLNNPRLYAQQGLFMVTNVADLETFIHFYEQSRGERAVTAIDIPIKVAAEALEDLAYMGLTAASMFPGLDGVCRKIKHKMSFKRKSLEPAKLSPPQKSERGADESVGESDEPLN